MTKFRLLCHEPSPGDSTSFYRASGPLGPLELETEWLTVQYTNDYHEHYGYKINGFFLQRPFMNEHLHAIKLCQKCGNKVWVDYDDALLTVNSENPAYSFYANPKVKETVKEILSIADFVSCTGEDLAKLLREYNANVFVIPNALSDRLLKFRPENILENRQRLVMWRGGSSHERDIRQFQDIIASAINQFPDWRWDFIGARFWFLADEFENNPRMTFTEWMNHADFHEHLIKQQPTLNIVPLADNVFNRSKSNISWLEGAYAGAASLVPNWPVWKAPGAFTYDGRESFETSLFAMLQDMVDAKEAAQASFEHVKQTLLLSQVNKLRLDLIEKMR